MAERLGRLCWETDQAFMSPWSLGLLLGSMGRGWTPLLPPTCGPLRPNLSLCCCCWMDCVPTWRGSGLLAELLLSADFLPLDSSSRTPPYMDCLRERPGKSCSISIAGKRHVRRKISYGVSPTGRCHQCSVLNPPGNIWLSPTSSQCMRHQPLRVVEVVLCRIICSRW